MREFKFRAWERKLKEIIPVTDIVFDTQVINSNGAWRMFSEIDLMQYTGLKDTEGKEIYEGDIVSFTYWWFDGSERETELTGTIVYEPERLAFALRGIKNQEWLKHVGANDSDTESFATFRFEKDDFKVIGNIYEKGKA